MGKSTLKAEKTLLWTNTSPTLVFGGQSVQLDLSDYSEVEVVFICWTTAQEVTEAIRVPIGISGRAFSPMAVNVFRVFATTVSGVAFEDARGYSSYGAWGEAIQNGACIPWKIYGIK